MDRQQPDPVTEARAALASVAADWIEKAAHLEKLRTEVEELADQLRVGLRPGQSVTVADGTTVGVVPGANRWDPKLAEQLLTAEQLALITEQITVVSKELARMYLPGAVFDTLHTRNRPMVKVIT